MTDKNVRGPYKKDKPKSFSRISYRCAEEDKELWRKAASKSNYRNVTQWVIATLNAAAGKKEPIKLGKKHGKA